MYWLRVDWFAGFLVLSCFFLVSFILYLHYSYFLRLRIYDWRVHYQRLRNSSYYRNIVEELRGVRGGEKKPVNVTVGVSEVGFTEHLRYYFGKCINTGFSVAIPGAERRYVPDICYVDQLRNLWIDIEIDEPYVLKTGEPIHYVECWRDTHRNNYFMSLGWVVIRFSEEQVVRYPKQCCKFIAQQVSEILLDTAILQMFNGVPDLIHQPMWFYADAVNMFYQNYRQQYLFNKSSKRRLKR